MSSCLYLLEWGVRFVGRCYSGCDIVRVAPVVFW